MNDDTPNYESINRKDAADGADDDHLDRPLLDILGVVPEFAPDHLSPAVDERRLIALIRDELRPNERSEVFELVTSFRPWFDRWRLLLRRETDSP